MASRFPSVTEKDIFVSNEKAILANMKRTTKFELSVFLC